MSDYALLRQYIDEHIEPHLRPYQKKFIDFCASTSRVIVGAPTGTGKTLMAIVSVFKHVQSPRKVLILCSKNALWTWQKELQKWLPGFYTAEDICIVSGTPAKRAKLWARDTPVFVCVYQSAARDMNILLKQKWDVLICDEYHACGLRNHKSSNAQAVAAIASRIPVVRLLSATPISKGPQEYFMPLHICDKKQFAHYWPFVNTFCVVMDTAFGKVVTGVRNAELFKQSTARSLYIIPQNAAEEYLPPFVRKFVPIEMSPIQRKMHEDLRKELCTLLSSGYRLMAPNAAAAVIRLRQLLVHPVLLDATLKTVSPGLETIWEIIQEHNDLHCVIFTPFRAAVTLIVDYLKARGVEYVDYLWGGLGPDAVRDAVAHWKAYGGVMVCSIQFSQSFELDTATHCYFLGYDWDQNNNIQAEGRLRRLTNPKSVTSTYIFYKDSIDERVLDVLNDKTYINNITAESFY